MVSMVHTFILGGSLLASIHRNLITREHITDACGTNRWGKPVWECAWEHDGDRAAVENATLTYLGRLLPLSRAIRLHEGGGSFILANGLDYPTFPAFREATATIISRKDELAVLPASTARSFWRQLSAIAIQRRAGHDAASGPLALNHVSTTTDTTLWVGALVTDKAKIEDVVESTYSLPPGMFTELGRAGYERGVALAEEREGVLIQSVKAHSSAPRKSRRASSRIRGTGSACWPTRPRKSAWIIPTAAARRTAAACR
jgi:CRISPR system Cascade subunit CasA